MTQPEMQNAAITIAWTDSRISRPFTLTQPGSCWQIVVCLPDRLTA